MTDSKTTQLRKILTSAEAKFLKIGNRMLLEQTNGRIASAAFMDIVADWHSSRAVDGFEAYAKGWILDGNCKNKHAAKLLRDLFGLETDPTPNRRRAA